MTLCVCVGELLGCGEQKDDKRQPAASMPGEMIVGMLPARLGSACIRRQITLPELVCMAMHGADPACEKNVCVFYIVRSAAEKRKHR